MSPLGVGRRVIFPRRWLSEDPAGSSPEPSSLNFYAYVNNSPLNFVDPGGTDAAVAAVVLGITLEVPGLDLVVGVGILAYGGYLAYEAISQNQHIQEARRAKQDKRRVEQAVEQFGHLSEHVNKALNMDPKKRGSVIKEILAALGTKQNSVQKTGKSFQEMIEACFRDNPDLRDEVLAQLNELKDKLRELAIDPDKFFEPGNPVTDPSHNFNP